MSDYLSCLQAARLMGVSQSTVKRMCDENVFDAVRTLGGHRRIPAEQVKDFTRLNGQNSHAAPGRKRSTLSVQTVLDLLLCGDSQQLTTLLWHQLPQIGELPQLLDNYLAPAMWEVGRRWEQGELDVFEEHVGTRTLHQVLTLLSSRMGLGEFTPTGPLAMGCSLGGDQHAIAGEMLDLVFKRLGWQCTHLGANVPLASLLSALRRYNPRVIWISYTVITDPSQVYEENAELFSKLDSLQRLIVGGQALTAEHRRKMRFHFNGDSFTHLASFLADVADAATDARQSGVNE